MPRVQSQWAKMIMLAEILGFQVILLVKILNVTSRASTQATPKEDKTSRIKIKSSTLRIANASTFQRLRS